MWSRCLGQGRGETGPPAAADAAPVGRPSSRSVAELPPRVRDVKTPGSSTTTQRLSFFYILEGLGRQVMILHPQTGHGGEIQTVRFFFAHPVLPSVHARSARVGIGERESRRAWGQQLVVRGQLHLPSGKLVMRVGPFESTTTQFPGIFCTHTTPNPDAQKAENSL